MSRLRRSITAALTVVAAGAFVLGPSAGEALAGTGGAVPDGGPMVFSGTASMQAGVVLDALGDHVHVGTCSGRDPVGMFSSFTAYLVEVPTPLLGGNVECGKQIAVTNASGTSVNATIVGSCGSCSGSDLALSPALYARMVSVDKHASSIPVTWKFVT